MRFTSRLLREEEKVDYKERLGVLTSYSESDGNLQHGLIHDEAEALKNGEVGAKKGIDEMRSVAGFLAGR